MVQEDWCFIIVSFFKLFYNKIQDDEKQTLTISITKLDESPLLLI